MTDDDPQEIGDKQREHLRAAYLEQSKGLATAVLGVSGTALSASVAIFTKTSATLVATGWLRAAWLLLGAAMVFQVFTYVTSTYAIRRVLEDGKQPQHIRFRSFGWWTEIAIWAATSCLLLGLLSLVLFATSNITEGK